MRHLVFNYSVMQADLSMRFNNIVCCLAKLAWKRIYLPFMCTRNILTQIDWFFILRSGKEARGSHFFELPPDKTEVSGSNPEWPTTDNSRKSSL